MHYSAVIFALFFLWAPEPKSPAAPGAPAPQEGKTTVEQQALSAADLVARFTKYQIAVVRKGPKWTKDAPKKIEELSAGNEHSFKSMVAQGKLLGIARLVDPSEFWGLVFFKVDTKEEMKSIVEGAPSVKAGLLSAEVRTVWGSRGLGAGLSEAPGGSMQMDPKDKTYFVLVMKKGPKWSEKADSPETRKATSDAMQHMFGLYKDGYLRYFAAFEDMSLKARSLSILNVSSADKAMKLAGESPAVKHGWTVPSVYEVKIPDGIIP